jgi:hypothetical protein
MALKTGAQIVTDWETAAGLEAASLALDLALRVTVPNALTSVGRRIAPDGDTHNLEELRPHDVAACAHGRTSANSVSNIAHGLTGQGLVTLMSLLPTHSRITVSDPLNLSPATRRNLARFAQERGLVLEFSEAVST